MSEGGNIKFSGYHRIRVALKVRMPAISGVLIGDFLPENRGTFSPFLCLIKYLILVQHQFFVKNWCWAKKRAYVSGFGPVRPVSIPAYELRGQAKAFLDIF